MISPELLTPRDHLRAKTALADVLKELGFQSTYDMIEDVEYAVPFAMWCLKTRTVPEFTWDQALDTPYLIETEIGESGPPQILAPPTSGASGDGSPSKRKPAATATAPSSASSSG